MLVLEGQETPGFATALDRPSTLNVNRSAAPTGKNDAAVWKLVVRHSEAGPCSGEIRIRPAE